MDIKCMIAVDVVSYIILLLRLFMGPCAYEQKLVSIPAQLKMAT